MTTADKDITGSLLLGLRHRLMLVRSLPVRGSTRISRLIDQWIPCPEVTGTCRVKTLHGFDMLVDPVLDKGVERAIFKYGTYEYGTLRMLGRILPKGGTFIDIGANIGLMTLYAAKAVGPQGKVFAFEPMPSTYQILQTNIQINGFTNITAEQAAIGSSPATATIYENFSVNRGAATLIAQPDAQHYDVPVLTLDDYVKVHKIDGIACMKIDVEGWELEALHGANGVLAGRNSPAVIVECSGDRETQGGTTRDIYDFLAQSGSNEIYRLARGKEMSSKLRRVKRDALPAHDNLICLSSAHVAKLPRDCFE